MNRADSRNRKQSMSVQGILYYAVAGLFVLTMLSVWMVSGLYAKYTTVGSELDSARVGKGLQLQLLEHEAELVNGEYVLHDGKNNTDDVEVAKNTYSKVLPGVDIRKDPFVRLSGTCEVDYRLYVQITEENFPSYENKNGESVKAVTYDVTDDWEYVPDQSNPDDGVYVYIYKGYLDSGYYSGSEANDIPVLEKNSHGCELTVSQYYQGDGDFSLSFKAWIVQVD